MQRRLRAAATERLPLKLAALFFALVLWMVVSAEEQGEEVVPVRLALPLSDSTVKLRSALPQVRALVVGRGRELVKLYATPPTVRPQMRQVGADAETAVLELRPVDVEIPPNVDARVRDVQPRVVPLQFEIRAQRLVPVRSALRLTGSGVRLAGPPRFEPESVRISGPHRAVSAIESVPTAVIDLVVRDGAPQTVPLDTGRLTVRVAPAVVSVRVPVEPAVASADTLTDLMGQAAPDTAP